MTKFEPIVMDYVKTLDVDRLQRKFPLYFDHFNKFWQNLVQLNPSYAEKPNIKQSSLLNCIYFVKLTAFMPEIKISIATDTSRMHQYFLKEKISYRLSGRPVKFVEDSHSADIIITDVNFLKPTSSQQEIIQIQPTLSEIDLIHIKSIVEKREKED